MSCFGIDLFILIATKLHHMPTCDYLVGDLESSLYVLELPDVARVDVESRDSLPSEMHQRANRAAHFNRLIAPA